MNVTLVREWDVVCIETKGLEENKESRKQYEPTTLNISASNLFHIPAGIEQLFGLKSLFLNNNFLDKFDKRLCLLKNLEVLNLSHNLIKKVPVEVFYLVNLRDLNLNNNFIVDLPEQIGALRNLKSLHVHNTPLEVVLKTKRDTWSTQEIIEFMTQTCQYAIPSRLPLLPPQNWVGIRQPTNPRTAVSIVSYCVIGLTRKPPQQQRSEHDRPNQNISKLWLELQKLSSNIVCLQAVDESIYNSVFRELFSNKNYHATFHLLSDSLPYGCCLFTRNSSCTVIMEQFIDLSVLVNTHFSSFPTFSISKNFFILSLLRFPDQVLLCVNVHFPPTPKSLPISLFMATALLNHLHAVCCKHGASSILISGHFNMSPSSALLELFTTGSVSENHPDIEASRYQARLFVSPICFSSAYSKLRHPPTCFQPLPQTTDYILYSNQSLLLDALVSPHLLSSYITTAYFPNTNFPSDHCAIGASFSAS